MPTVLTSWWVYWECDECGATGDAGPFDYGDLDEDYGADHECEADA